MEDEYNYPPRMKWADKIKELEKERDAWKLEAEKLICIIAKLSEEIINGRN